MTLTKLQQLEALETRRDTLLTQIAALTESEIGGGPDTSGGGEHVQQVAYRQSLYEELEQIERSLSLLRGPWIVRRQGRLA
ncbi:hypothetical protein LOC68_09850 [Blastopirellula sp. JC732]|uniref:Uncharacterized protein n=1 Tax=Blastopirellula sediminis TaxID=2894196 RepID=A0A9X1MKU9_9BACT|nr:hypothetical protein [Blastopirellula sediminis]MCC9608522.1 hypothetical protein [Blastopirellula sediminis]MCC9628701.1 hypothetical protein [Blastopirellula sediminis]